MSPFIFSRRHLIVEFWLMRRLSWIEIPSGGLSFSFFLLLSGVDFSLMSQLTAKLYQESKWGSGAKVKLTLSGKKENQKDKMEDIEENCQIRAICINFPPLSCPALTSCTFIQWANYIWAHAGCWKQQRHPQRSSMFCSFNNGSDCF